MPPDRSDTSYLWDMLQAAMGVSSAVAGIDFAAYSADENLRLAIERRIEIIGEAAGRVSAAFQAAHVEIPWRQIIGQRHVLAHNYANIDNRLIWAVATQRIPELIAFLQGIDLAEPPGAPSAGPAE